MMQEPEKLSKQLESKQHDINSNQEYSSTCSDLQFSKTIYRFFYKPTKSYLLALILVDFFSVRIS